MVVQNICGMRFRAGLSRHFQQPYSGASYFGCPVPHRAEWVLEQVDIPAFRDLGPSQTRVSRSELGQFLSVRERALSPPNGKNDNVRGLGSRTKDASQGWRLVNEYHKAMTENLASVSLTIATSVLERIESPNLRLEN
jgi:hypothetical protein